MNTTDVWRYGYSRTSPAALSISMNISKYRIRGSTPARAEPVHPGRVMCPFRRGAVGPETEAHHLPIPFQELFAHQVRVGLPMGHGAAGVFQQVGVAKPRRSVEHYHFYDHLTLLPFPSE